MKRCPYCLREHNRKGAKYCSESHAKAAARQNARAAGRYKRWLARNRRHKQQLRLDESQWRDVTMGRSVETLIAAIFEKKR